MYRVLITTGIFPPDIGGPASYAVNLGKYVSSKDKVTVITYSSKFSVQKDKDLPFKVIRVWKKWPIWVKHFFFGVQALAHVRNSDIILALNVWNAGFPTYIACRIFKKKFFIRIVGDYAWEVAVGKKKTDLLIDDFQKSEKSGWIKMLAGLQTKIIQKADIVIVPSQYLADIIQGWGIGREKIHVIYNGVDFKKSDLVKEEARKKIGIPGNIILSGGRLVPWKGFRMLIKVMPKLLEISQFSRLVIIGDGPEKNNLESMIRNIGLDKKVYLVGKKSKEEIAVYMAAADMFVLNSGYEGFSHQLLEAMAAGVPVVASAVGGNKEVIDQGKNGFLVKYNDEFNLVEAIKGLWQEPEMREQFIEEGKKTVKKFSLEKMIEETMRLLIL